jgi:two-component system phosphate regulon sensor histidine kinase PhoR
MVCTIGAIIAFQVAWLRKSYTEEKALFTARTNLLFRETMFRLQNEHLATDSFAEARVENKNGTLVLTGVSKNSSVRPDSPDGLQRVQTLAFNIKGDDIHRKDDPGGDSLHRGGGQEVRILLAGMDSMQSRISLKEITAHYQKGLDSIGVHIPFRVINVPLKTPLRKLDTTAFPFQKKITLRLPLGPVFRTSDNNSSENIVTLGFSHPMSYKVEFDDPSWLIARRIGVQALFSLLLVGFTTGSFLMLYRNWRKQQRLTELKNDFIGNMTHELKTPIATVSVAVEALRHFNALQDPVRTQEYLEISAGELRRLSLMVDKVLKLSLFETKGIELKNESFDLRALAEEVMASMRLQFDKYKAKLSLETEGTDFSLRADKLHITSVIFNLLDNALKYSREDPRIRVGLTGEPEQVVLSVTDNGMGIPSAYIGKIFEKFFRVPTGDQHNVKGYGLGLSYVSYVLQRHGGRISVESEEGVGSRFIIKLPRDHD